MRNPLVAWLSLSILLSLAGLPVHADNFRAELNRTRVGADETLTLHLSADGALDGTPDLKPLTQDFEILSQGTGTSMSVINGAMSHTREWTLELAPRRTGRLQIPAIALDGRQTTPIPVDVVAADQAATGSGPKPVFVDTTVEQTAPYVQQPVVYRVRVLYREQPWRAALADPQVEGATLDRQGEDQNYTETIQGQTYTVIERRYLVVPQRSGPIIIRGPRLEALLPQGRPAARRGPLTDFGDIFGGVLSPNGAGAGRRVIEHGPDRTIEVRAQPAGSTGAWLPAESVQLSDEWTPSPPRFRAGEPVTRTLVITARGATAAQLPTLDPGTLADAKVYPELPKVEDLPGPAPSALKTLKIALVPTHSGPLTLPEIRLPWWDTGADEGRVAIIPARTVQVEPAVDEPAHPEPEPRPETAGLPAAPTAPAAAQRATDTPQTPAPTGGAGPTSELNVPWPWVALFFALAWLGTLVWAILRRRNQGRPAAAPHRDQTMSAARAQVCRACAAADPRAARTALLAWAQACWPRHPPRGLGDLAAHLGLEATMLDPIDRAIYAAPGETWDGAATWRLLEPVLVTPERPGRRPRTDPLPDLYPQPGR